jgi:hypothetical protein
MKNLLFLLIYFSAIYNPANADGLFLLGRKKHDGIKVELWSQSGSLLYTAQSDVDGKVEVADFDPSVYYKVKAQREGYHTLEIDSVQLSYATYLKNGVIFRPILFNIYEAVMLPSNSIIIRDSLKNDLSDTSVFFIVENTCFVSGNIRITPGVKIAFKGRANFSVRKKSTLSFKGTKEDSVYIFRYPYEQFLQSGDGAKLKLEDSVNITVEYACVYGLSVSPHFSSAMHISNSNLEQLLVFANGNITITDCRIDYVNYNDTTGSATPNTITFNRNHINEFNVTRMNGALSMSSNIVKSYINLRYTYLPVMFADNTIAEFNAEDVAGARIECNRLSGNFRINSVSTNTNEGNILMSENIFTSPDSENNISIYNKRGYTEIKNNYFGTPGRISIRPSDYMWISTRQQIVEGNTFTGDLIIVSDNQNKQRPLKFVRNIMKGRIISPEVELEMNNNLLQEPLMCICTPEKIFLNSANEQIDANNNLYNKDIRLLYDTIPVLINYDGRFSLPVGVEIENTCLEKVYGIYLNQLKPSIAGKVFAGDTLIRTGYVAAIRIPDGNTRIVPVRQDGSYSIENLMAGNYFMQALPFNSNTCTNEKLPNDCLESETTQSYLPSIYLNKLEFTNANKLMLEGRIEDADLHLIKNTNTLNTKGSGSIKGTMVYKDTLISDYGTPWMDNLIGSEWKRTDNRNYVCINVPVIVRNAMGKPVAWTISDINGAFEIKNLQEGNYTLSIQRAGFELQIEGGNAIYANGQPAICYLIKSTQMVTNTIDFPDNQTSISVVPNPFINTFTITGNNSKQEIFIYNISGQLVKQFNYQESNNYNAEEIPRGVYFVRTGNKFEKIMKE